MHDTLHAPTGACEQDSFLPRLMTFLEALSMLVHSPARANRLPSRRLSATVLPPSAPVAGWHQSCLGLATLGVVVALSLGTAQAADKQPEAKQPVAAETATGAPQAPLDQLAAHGWRDSNDQPFDPKQLKGKPVVINFWATWCAPCVKEMPLLSALSEEIGDEAVFLGISLDKLEKVKRFTDKAPVAYPLLIADFKGLSLSRQWGNKQGQMPYTVVLNAQGKLHWQHAGLVNVEELRSMLKSAELR